MTGLGKYGIIILSLLIVPGLVFQAYAQYDYPEGISQEDIAKMMPQEISGKFSDSRYGVSVEFPDGWSGMKTDFTDPQTGSSITAIQVWEGGMMANMQKLQKGEFEMIMLSITDKIDTETLPEPESPDPQNPADCEYIFAETIKVDGKNAMKLEMECISSKMSIKMRVYHFTTGEKFITYGYATSPSSDFDNNLDTFENSAKTLSISNLEDISYEIPDELKAKSGQENNQPQSETMEESNLQIPDWVRGNAEWWAQGAIGDSDFVSGIQFLIKEGIMQIPETQKAETADDSQEIPSWIKNNADWWAQGLISDDDFVKGIQYLVEQGIIQV